MEKVIKISDKIILWLSRDRNRTKGKLAEYLNISRPTLDNKLKDNSWERELTDKLERLNII